jgi:ABC-type Mn2+/Zn2+ transport system ATPase subunit
LLAQGSLTVVAGSVGTGKSSFLKAILGQLHLVSGSAHAGGTYAYVPQVRLLSLSVRFGSLDPMPVEFSGFCMPKTLPVHDIFPT